MPPNDSEKRPDPDALLRRVTAEEERKRRAKLKIFFGFAPGVGKTFSMLESARRLAEQGVDVVVGCVETHGRRETEALVEGLEVLPRRVVSYRSARLEELDLEAALERRPRVLLVDELAHTNAPGVRHAKRYQDVLDLLDAGIEVHTTLNVQHVESLNDVVAQVTQVRVRETVPDAILDRADEIELVDLPPEELLERLREGKVYVPEQATRAARHFFQRGNLLALRELALRRTADRVDADVQAYREEHAIERTWAAAERILVCVGPSPASARVIRGARRMAAGLRAPWIAAYVETTLSAPLSPEDAERLDAHLRLAESLGGEIARLSGDRISEAILSHALKHDVTRIVVGKPTHPRLRDRLRGSLLDEIVRGSGDIDVHVISGDSAEGTLAARPPRIEPLVPTLDYAWSVLLVVVATGFAALLRTALALPDLVVLYLAVIILVAGRFGRGPSLLAAVLSVASYDFFFVPPFYTFAVSDGRHALTFLIMFATGLFIGGQTRRIRQQEQHARERERRTAALYALSRELGSALDERRTAGILVEHMRDVFGCGVALLVPGPEAGSLRELASAGAVAIGPAEEGVAKWVLEHGRSAGRGTDTLPGARVVCLPLRARADVLGVVLLAQPEGRTLDLGERDLLDAFIRQAALALERARLAEEAKTAALKARSEEMRSSLLSAVSHDLRTPLAVITGAATTLRDDSTTLVKPHERELLETLCEEAERLEHLVSNLLDMTRMESGGFRVQREWVPLDEIVGSALARTEPRLGGRPIETMLDEALPLLSVDPVLFEQVFVNLLENVAKYTPAGSPVEIAARPAGVHAVVEVRDRGPGIPRGTEERIFEKFFRGVHVGIGGVGLGLPICRSIVEAHGGTITAENRSGGGATFRILLPLLEGAPSVLSDPPISSTSEDAG